MFVQVTDWPTTTETVWGSNELSTDAMATLGRLAPRGICVTEEEQAASVIAQRAIARTVRIRSLIASP